MTKYRSTPTFVDGIRFASKKEAKRWGELSLLQKAGQICDLDCQVRYELIPKQLGERACWYVCDFRYCHVQSRAIFVEDVKGMRTPVYKIKKKLMLKIHGIRITEI